MNLFENYLINQGRKANGTAYAYSTAHAYRREMEKFLTIQQINNYYATFIIPQPEPNYHGTKQAAMRAWKRYCINRITQTL